MQLFPDIYKDYASVDQTGYIFCWFLVFINCWNEYLYSLTFMSKDAMRTVPVGIALFPSNYQLPWGDMAAASIVCTLPLIALVLIFQKNIVAGLTTGGMKG